MPTLRMSILGDFAPAHSRYVRTHAHPSTPPRLRSVCAPLFRYFHTLPFLLLRSRAPRLLALAVLAGIEVRWAGPAPARITMLPAGDSFSCPPWGARMGGCGSLQWTVRNHCTAAQGARGAARAPHGCAVHGVPVALHLLRAVTALPPAGCIQCLPSPPLGLRTPAGPAHGSTGCHPGLYGLLPRGRWQRGSGACAQRGGGSRGGGSG